MSDANEPPIPKIDVRHRGGGRDLGLAIGTTLKQRIERAQHSVSEFETFRSHRPWWIPFSAYRILAEWRARRVLEPSFAASFPNMAERIRGIAEGADTSIDFLYLFHAMESLSTSADSVTNPALAGCTAIAATGNCTTDGTGIIAHNFDLVDLAAPLMAMRETKSTNGLRYLGLTLAPMAGTVDGINEAGLAISYDYAPTTDVQPHNPPVSFGVDETLASCVTVADAVKRLRKLPRSGGALLMLADATGDIAALELSANHYAVRRPEGSGRIHHSNAYHTKKMRSHELPRSSVYSEAAPEPLRNIPVFQSAERRDDRVRQLLQSREQLCPERFDRIMADHGADDRPTADTVCMHGGYWSTLASIQLLPAKRRIRLSYGPACEAVYAEFQL